MTIRSWETFLCTVLYRDSYQLGWMMPHVPRGQWEMRGSPSVRLSAPRAWCSRDIIAPPRAGKVGGAKGTSWRRTRARRAVVQYRQALTRNSVGVSAEILVLDVRTGGVAGRVSGSIPEATSNRQRGSW